jgi:hypothetical protein
MSEPKPERITEAELLKWAGSLARIYMDDRPPASLEPLAQARLVAEVRRLRGLIVDAIEVSGYVDGRPIYTMQPTALVAEAEAIRAER